MGSGVSAAVARFFSLRASPRGAYDIRLGEGDSPRFAPRTAQNGDSPRRICGRLQLMDAPRIAILAIGIDAMGLRDLLFPLQARRRLARIAAEIGRRSLPLAAAAVGNRMLSMTLPEARGYIRARARLAVQAEIDALSISGQALSPAMSHQLVELALEQVVVRMMAQRVVEQPVSLVVRRAA